MAEYAPQKTICPKMVKNDKIKEKSAAKGRNPPKGGRNLPQSGRNPPQIPNSQHHLLKATGPHIHFLNLLCLGRVLINPELIWVALT